MLSLFAGLGVLGCDDTGGSSNGNDLATATVADMAQGAVVHDLATSNSGDGGGGLKAICAACTVNSECESGMCLPYMGGQKHFCSHSCATASAATDCPGVAMCNGMNVCKCM